MREVRFCFHQNAESEFDKAVEYYEDFRSGFCQGELVHEVYAVITRVHLAS